jgi:hypothetical protein
MVPDDAVEIEVTFKLQLRPTFVELPTMPKQFDPLTQCKSCALSGEDDCPVEEPDNICPHWKGKEAGNAYANYHPHFKGRAEPLEQDNESRAISDATMEILKDAPSGTPEQIVKAIIDTVDMAEKKADGTPCPVCGKPFKRLAMHYTKSPKCRLKPEPKPEKEPRPLAKRTGFKRKVCPKCSRSIIEERLEAHMQTKYCKTKELSDQRKYERVETAEAEEKVKAKEEEWEAATADTYQCKHCHKNCRTYAARMKHEPKCPENPDRKNRNANYFDTRKKEEPTPVEEEKEEGCEGCEYFSCGAWNSSCCNPALPKGQDSNLLEWNPPPEWCPKRAKDGELSPEEIKDVEQSYKDMAEGNCTTIPGNVTDEEFIAILGGEASPIARENNPKGTPPEVCLKCGKTIFGVMEQHDKKCKGTPCVKAHKPDVKPLDLTGLDKTKPELMPEEVDNKYKNFKLPDPKQHLVRHCTACGVEIDKRRKIPLCKKCDKLSSSRAKEAAKDVEKKAGRWT